MRSWLTSSLALGLAGLVLVGALAAPQETPFGRYYALVIGNNDYRNLPKLETAVGDAEAVAEVLKARYGFEVQLLRNATRRDILGALNDYRAELTQDDNLLIYYAGHGFVDRQTDTGFWQPVDAEETDDLNWIANDDLTRRLNAMTARHVMVIADSCYSGTLVRSSTAEIPTGHEREAWLQRMAEKRSRTAIVSGGIEPVADAGRGGHSVFASALLTALEENRDYIEGSSLFQQISRPVVVNAEQTPQYSDIRKAGHEGGQFIFVPLVISPEAVIAAGKAQAASDDKAMELAFWQSIQASARAGDFEAYLTRYPDGVFASLAQSRLEGLQRQAKAEAAAPVAGKWVSETLTNPYLKTDTFRFAFEFRRVGDVLLGTVSRAATKENPRQYEKAAQPLLDGRIEGDVISFAESFESVAGNSVERHRRRFVGKLDGDGIAFLVQDTMNNPPVEFRANRVEVK